MTNSMPGHIFLASPTLVPVLTPNFLASIEAAMHTVVSAIIGTTPSGFPRSRGSTCCSTEAKYELKSTRSERRVVVRPLFRHVQGPVRGLHELAAEHERVGDVRDRRDRRPGARDEDGAEVEEAAPHALLDLQ